MNTNERDDNPYCESCRVAHPTPRDVAHKEALQCNGVWYFADTSQSFSERVDAVVTPLMKELETTLLGRIDAALDKAFINGASRMREACVAAVKGLWTTDRSNDYNEALNDVLREIESLTLEAAANSVKNDEGEGES